MDYLLLKLFIIRLTNFKIWLKLIKIFCL